VAGRNVLIGSSPIRRVASIVGASALLAAALAAVPSSADAAASSKLSFAKGIGAALPNKGGMVQVAVACSGGAKRGCRGSVALVPRDATEEALGGDDVASEGFEVGRNRTKTIRLDLGDSAHEILGDGRLRLTAVLRSAGSRKPVAAREVAVERAQIDTRPVRISVRRLAANTEEFSFVWNVTAGHYIVVKRWTCPAELPRVAAGFEVGFDIRLAKIRYAASDGTGYMGFRIPAISNRVELHTKGHFYRNMLGWSEGNFWENSIWAPLGSAGRFELTVTCTDGDRVFESAIWHDNENRDDPSYYGQIFPWRTPH
jgi:hypothetical protein